MMEDEEDDDDDDNDDDDDDDDDDNDDVQQQLSMIRMRCWHTSHAANSFLACCTSRIAL